MVTTRSSNQQGSHPNRDKILARSNYPITLETFRHQADVFGYELQFLVSGVLPVFRTYREKRQMCLCACVFFTLTDWASIIPRNIRGCQFGLWSAGQGNIRGTSTKIQREHENLKNKNKAKATERKGGIQQH